MKGRTRIISALLLLCVGAASAQTPARQLLGNSYKYIPQGCPITVSISADESQPSWFQDAPEIRGQVTLSNPTQYDVPISSIIVQASSSNGQLYSTQAWCNNGRSTVVPYNPQAYTYGTTTCRYRLVLDRNVFGTYGQHGSRRLLSNGGVQANFFPGSSSGGSSSSSGSGSGSGGYGYFPPPNQRPSWTVTAIATVSYSNAQCLSAPTPVNTDCWWDWLASWYNRHHHSWWSSHFGGRRLLSNTKAAVPQTPSKLDAAESSQQRKLMGADSVDGYYRRAERAGSYSGAGVYSVTGPDGGSVEGAHTGSGQYERDTHTYYRRPYANGRKLMSADSGSSRSEEHSGSSSGPVEWSSATSGGSFQGSRAAALDKRIPLVPGGVWHFHHPGRQYYVTDQESSHFSSSDDSYSSGDDSYSSGDDNSRNLLSTDSGESYVKAHAYAEAPPTWQFNPPAEVFDINALATDE